MQCYPKLIFLLIKLICMSQHIHLKQWFSTHHAEHNQKYFQFYN